MVSHFGAFEVHSYGGAFDWRTEHAFDWCYPMREGVEKFADWVAYARRQGKPFFLGELGTFDYGMGGNNLPEPNADGTDGSFATLRRAREAVRGLRDADGNLPGPVTAQVRGGKYYPGQTLHLSAADSGTADAPVTHAAYPGETPIISDGRRVTGWKPYRTVMTGPDRFGVTPHRLQLRRRAPQGDRGAETIVGANGG